ncbi:anaerobic sulfatase maturase [Breznakiella homolactica]|uniref:Anaerobic sulfatase maturase n=1 Tax=Breznakiella homolactica TaxID=2798577 RepID=A0A7T7XLK5_9SPIR|nr:anaerobic sulfatase maturase [Breznakiella homolactica]QQO08545.1 anaerobic sulfatase maturase [Breznakiella homolactica]
MTTEPFVVMVKPVGSLCNMECSYCYYSKPGSGQSPGQSRMTDQLLEQFIRQYIESSPGPHVSFVWHGGEPTLAGLDFYRRVVELQKRYLPEGWNCWNNLQTNGILIDDEWCAFLAKERFDVGLSIDGAQWLHDTYRMDHKSGGSYERAAAAVRRLQSHGIQPDLLCTVTSDAAKRPLDIYRALRGFNTGWIQFIPIVRRESHESMPHGEVTADSVTGRMYGEFLCAVFDEWILHDLGRLDVQVFAESMRVLAGGSAGLCWMAPVCGRALIVERDGGVYSCDHFVMPEYRIGEIGTAQLGDLADSSVQRRFGEAKRSSLPAQCRSCPSLALCNGGCPKDRFVLSDDGEPGLNYLCEGLRRFFSYIEPAVNMVNVLAKQGHTPEAIMANLRSRLAVLWKGVGRNDLCPCGSGRKAKHCCWAKRPV